MEQQEIITQYRKVLKGHDVWTLRAMADTLCDLDAKDSHAAQWLDDIRDDAAEAMDDRDFDLDKFKDESISEMADQAVFNFNLESRGTYRKWCVFTELGAWNEDLDELGGMPDSMNKGADYALYLIATRLLLTIAGEIEEALNDAS